MSCKDVRKMARAFGTEIIIDSPGPRARCATPPRRRVPTIIFEAGDVPLPAEHGARVSPAVRNVLVALG